VPIARIPELDQPVGAARREAAAIGRDGQRIDGIVAQRLGVVGKCNLLVARQVPEADAVIGGHGDKPRAAGSKSDALDVLGIAVELAVGRPAGLHRLVPAPEIDVAVLAGGGEQGAVRREGHCVDGEFIAGQRRLERAARQVEQPHLAIGRVGAKPRTEIAAGGKRPAVGREGEREYLAVVVVALVAAQHLQRGAALPVPDADRLVVRGRGERLPIGREGEILDRAAMAAGVEVEAEVRRFGVGAGRACEQEGGGEKAGGKGAQYPQHPVAGVGRPPLRLASQATSPPIDGGEEALAGLLGAFPLPRAEGEVDRRSRDGVGVIVARQPDFKAVGKSRLRSLRYRAHGKPIASSRQGWWTRPAGGR